MSNLLAKIAHYALFFVILVLVSCQSEPAEAPPEVAPTEDAFEGARQMQARINQVIQKVAFVKHPYESSRKLAIVEPQLKAAQAQNKATPQMYVNYAKILLNAGESQRAIDVFEQIMEQIPANKTVAVENRGLHEARALAYLRLGEQLNCIENHSAESCLFPIRGEGVHTKPAASEKAIEIYESILRVIPDDLRSRWLLNLAYMTIGDYPDQVPAEWLMAPKLFESEAEIGHFSNISMNLGIDVNDLAGGSIVDDFNNDGLLDIVASSWDMAGEVRYFVNQGDGSFTEKTAGSGIDQLVGGLNMIQADYNNDGHLDFYILRSAWSGVDWMGQLPNSLIKNNGDGTFSDVTLTTGLYAEQPSQSAVWLDYNSDGWLDLFVSNETMVTSEPHPCQLFLNQQDGTFRDVAPAAGLDIVAYVKGVNAADVNNDGRPDLYLSLLTGANQLYLNQGGEDPASWQFEEVAQQAGVTQPEGSFPTWFFDFNNDGYEDIFVAGFDNFLLKQQALEMAADYLSKPVNATYSRLYQNKGDGSFQDVTKTKGLDRVLPAMGCNYGDLDNDGYPDFYLGTGAPDFRAIVPNRMFKNRAGEAFLDVTTAGGFGHIQKGHAISFADVDNDGDQDIYAVMGGSVSGDVFQNAFFENPGNGNDWLNLRLRGTKSNRSAIGARIKLLVTDSRDNTREIYQTLSSGGSFGANSLQAEIGLGAAAKQVQLFIDWPNGTPAYIDYGQVAPNQILAITEGEEPQKVDLTGFTFSKGTGEHHHH